MATTKSIDKEHGHNNQVNMKETPDKPSVLRMRRLSILTQEEASEHVFTLPVKRIHEGHDVTRFLSSKAFRSIMTFLYQLNTAMYPRTSSSNPNDPDSIQTWELDSSLIQTSNSVKKLQDLFRKLEEIIEEAPPDPGPQRFGNVSFRTWYKLVEERLPVLLKEHLPAEILANDLGTKADSCDAKDELLVYLLGSFGSAQRLDYGTGHELSFLAFLGCVWMLRGFTGPDSELIERSIVIGLIQPYLQLVRHLIKVYNLEPAGSHGVWGLDDHSFLPYIFGSAQYSPVLASLDKIPMEGSRLGAPDPGDVIKPAVVAAERSRNMYFSAIGFIHDVKKGPFWEHSPILYDISGVRAGWAKINKGMIKMYSAEVLSKFPVVQHFPFGSLFSWELDPEAIPTSQSIHTSSHPTLAGSTTNQLSAAALRGAPQATARTLPSGSTGVQGLASQSLTPAPWATRKH